jgi:hypothetical protein
MQECFGRYGNCSGQPVQLLSSIGLPLEGHESIAPKSFMPPYSNEFLSLCITDTEQRSPYPLSSPKKSLPYACERKQRPALFLSHHKSAISVSITETGAAMIHMAASMLLFQGTR